MVTLAKEYVVFNLIQLKSFYYNNPGSSPGTRRSAREFGPGTQLSALELGYIVGALELRFLGLAVTLGPRLQQFIPGLAWVEFCRL